MTRDGRKRVTNTSHVGEAILRTLRVAVAHFSAACTMTDVVVPAEVTPKTTLTIIDRVLAATIRQR